MKKYILLVIITILVIPLLIYFYDLKEDIQNKELVAKNVYIEYPYFNIKPIDDYINNYLDINISGTDSKIFMDYDYSKNNDLIDLYLYTYKEKDNTLKKIINNIEINTSTKDIVEDKIVKNIASSEEYDIYTNKKINRNKPMIALTFDDGPNANTTKILEILKKYNAKATFFILGTNIEGNENTIKRMQELDMEIASHMYSHKLITKLTDKEILAEIKKTDKLIYGLTNKYPSLIRPSYGTSNRKIKRLIDRPIILWDIDTLDWKYHNSKRISSKVINKVHDGDIVLMHDIYTATANSLEITIPKLQKKGYQLVTVSELFYYKNKELKPSVAYGSAK